MQSVSICMLEPPRIHKFRCRPSHDYSDTTPTYTAPDFLGVYGTQEPIEIAQKTFSQVQSQALHYTPPIQKKQLSQVSVRTLLTI